MTNQPVSRADAVAIINRTTNEPVAVGGRISVVDMGFNPVDMQLPQRPGLQQELASNDLAGWTVASSASVDLNVTNPVQRTCKFTMLDPLERGTPLLFDPWNHMILPYMRLSSAGITIELPLCAYLMGTPKATVYRKRRIYEWSGTDIVSLIGATDLLSDWTVTADYPGGYVQAILDLFISHAVPKSLGGQGQTPQGNDDAGPAIPLGMFDIDWSGNQTVGIPEIKRAGSKRLQAASELCGSVNYWPVYIGNRSRFQLRPKPNWSIAPPPSTWDYSTNGLSIITDQPQETLDSSQDARNVVRVEGGQSTQTNNLSYTSVKENNNPLSKMAYQNLKTLSGEPRALGYYTNNPNLANQAMTDLYADWLLEMGNLLRDRVTISTLPNPATEAYETYVMQITWKDGTVVIASDEQHGFLETGWTLPFLDPRGRMTHNLARVGAD